MNIARFLLAAACVLVSCNAMAQSRFSYSAGGAEVTDSQTSLVWRRCSAGQTWGGDTCTGAASTFTYENALAHARSQAGWRLPNVKELSSIVDKTKSSPLIDSVAFPATASSWYWTSSLYVANADLAWYVGFGYGDVYGDYRYNLNYVRLVR